MDSMSFQEAEEVLNTFMTLEDEGIISVDGVEVTVFEDKYCYEFSKDFVESILADVARLSTMLGLGELTVELT